MHLHTTVWSRDWERVSRAEDLTDGELLEYLRWMACNRPGKYAEVMTAFMDTHGQNARAFDTL